MSIFNTTNIVHNNKVNYSLKSLLEFDMVFVRNIISSNMSDLKSLEPKKTSLQPSIMTNLSVFFEKYVRLASAFYRTHPLTECSVKSLLANGLTNKNDKLKCDIVKMERIINRYGFESNIYDKCKHVDCSTLGCAHIQYVSDTSILNTQKSYVSKDGFYVVENVCEAKECVSNDNKNNGLYQKHFEIFPSDRREKLFQFMEKIYGVRFAISTPSPPPLTRKVKSQTKLLPPVSVHTNPEPIAVIDYDLSGQCLLLALYFQNRSDVNICIPNALVYTSENPIRGTSVAYMKEPSNFSVNIGGTQLGLAKQRLTLDNKNKSFRPKLMQSKNHAADKKSSSFVSEMVDIALQLLPSHFSDYHKQDVSGENELMDRLVATRGTIAFEMDTKMVHVVSGGTMDEKTIYALLCLLKNKKQVL